MKLLIVGKARNPRCFKHLKMDGLPVGGTIEVHGWPVYSSSTGCSRGTRNSQKRIEKFFYSLTTRLVTQQQTISKRSTFSSCQKTQPPWYNQEKICAKRPRLQPDDSSDSDDADESPLPKATDLLRYFSEGEKFFLRIGRFEMAKKAKELYDSTKEYQNANARQSTMDQFFFKK